MKSYFLPDAVLYKIIKSDYPLILRALSWNSIWMKLFKFFFLSFRSFWSLSTLCTALKLIRKVHFKIRQAYFETKTSAYKNIKERQMRSTFDLKLSITLKDRVRTSKLDIRQLTIALKRDKTSYARFAQTFH